MPATNPATMLAQDERIPGLPELPPGTDPATLTLPVYNPATDKTHQTPLRPGDGATTSNAVIGGPKFVRYLNSRTYGVPANALTLDRLAPTTIVPGTLATVDNPSDNPLNEVIPPQQYVAVVAESGGVLVPRYIGAASNDRVPIVWVEVAPNWNGVAALATKVSLEKAQALLTATVVSPGMFYSITGDWNATGTNSTVYVHGVKPAAFHRLGVVYGTDGLSQLVEVDAAAGTYKNLSGGGELLASNNTWTGENTYEQGITLGTADKGTLLLGDGSGLSLLDSETGQYQEIHLKDVLTSSDFYYKSLLGFVNIFKELATTTGTRIRWVQAGLTNYSSYGQTRGSIVRPYATLQQAHDAASEGDVICVLYGGTALDALGRRYYTDSIVWEKNVRIIFQPGVVYAGVLQCNRFGGSQAGRRELIGGEIIGRVICWRQRGVANELLITGTTFSGLGTFEVAGGGTNADEYVATGILRNCFIDSKLPAGSFGPLRLLGRDDMGPIALELDNTVVIAPQTAAITFQANAASRATLRGAATELRSLTKTQTTPTSPSGYQYQESDWLVDARPAVSASTPGTSTPGTSAPLRDIYIDATGPIATAVIAAKGQAGGFLNGEMQGSQPTGSAAGMKFTTNTYGFEYQRGADGLLVWCSYPKG
jgi:hypothetical protein